MTGTAQSTLQDRTEFISAMSRAATGVSVVTTDGAAGRFGLTVSAVSSVSAEPPMLLVCVNRKSPACEAIGANGSFAVNLLAADQRDVAATFAGLPGAAAPYDFGRHDWLPGRTGLPCLAAAAAAFECAIETTMDVGSHRIFIGRVMAANAGEANPLVYAGRTFCTVQTVQ